MPLTVLTDHAAIRSAVDPLLAADPVRNTILGTIMITLEDTAWAAAGIGFLAVRSSADYSVVLVGDWPADARTDLRRLLTSLPDLGGLAGPESQVSPLLDVLGPDVHLERQRLFRLDELTEPVGVAGRHIVGRGVHRAFARASWSALLAETFEYPGNPDAAIDRAVDGGHVHLWLDVTGEPVSMACRRPVLAGSARIGPVYTPPEHRGHGYGSGVTAAATRSILDEGGTPVLFTDLANPTSNKIYQALGYYPVEDRIVASRSSQPA